MKRKTIVTVFFTLTALLLSGGKAEGQQQETLARSSSPTARYAAEETGLRQPPRGRCRSVSGMLRKTT